MKNKLVSIVIRTINEEKWISRCLNLIRKQTYTNYEIIIVDTGSTDRTTEIIKMNYPECKVLVYDKEYRPGSVLNFGCKQTKGEYIVFLSAHCLPVNELWLENLARNMDEPLIAGVYGMQEPMEDTDPHDKRDLILTFGLDRKVQWNDPFFNNANSAIKKKLWEEVPFNDEVKNIEDRVWAMNLQKLGYCIIYEPEARVFHYHGIHQKRCEIRCQGVNDVLDNIHSYIIEDSEKPETIDKGSIHAVIPFSERITKALSFENIKDLFDLTVKDLESIECIKEIWLLTDSSRLIEYTKSKYDNIKVPYLRKDDIKDTLLVVLQDFVKSQNINHNDSVLLAEIVFFVKNRSLYFKKLCDEYYRTGHSSALWLSKNYNSIFRKTNDYFYRLDEDIHRFRGYKIPFYEVHEGLGKIICTKNIIKNCFHDANTLLLKRADDNLIIQINNNEDIEFLKGIGLNTSSLMKNNK